MPTARQLIKSWNIPVDYGLYSEWGNFFHVPGRYPAALIDSSGYLILFDRSALDRDGIRVTTRLNIPSGIKSLLGYVVFQVQTLPEEISHPEQYWEGALRHITVNGYERDPKARQACIAHFGSACRVCGLDFGRVYGALGRGYIHVHHIRPLSEIGEDYAVDPQKDLIPVCPNCHAMMHQRNPPLTEQELKQLIEAQ